MPNNSYKTLAKTGMLNSWKCMRCSKPLKPKVCEGCAVALCEPCNQEVAKMQTIMIEILGKQRLFERREIGGKLINVYYSRSKRV